MMLVDIFVSEVSRYHLKIERENFSDNLCGFNRGVRVTVFNIFIGKCNAD